MLPALLLCKWFPVSLPCSYKCPLLKMHPISEGGVIVTHQSCADKSLITDSRKVAKPECMASANNSHSVSSPAVSSYQPEETDCRAGNTCPQVVRATRRWLHQHTPAVLVGLPAKDHRQLDWNPGQGTCMTQPNKLRN